MTIPWELYNVTQDFSQARNLAKENPKKLQDLEALFLIEAAKYNVLPIDSSFADRANPAIRPNLNRGRTEFDILPGHDSHPRSERSRHQEQVVPHNR